MDFCLCASSLILHLLFCGKIRGQTDLGIEFSIPLCRTRKIGFQIFHSCPEKQLKSQNGVSDYFSHYWV